MSESHERVEQLARDILMSTVANIDKYNNEKLTYSTPKECFDLATRFYDESNERLKQSFKSDTQITEGPLS